MPPGRSDAAARRVLRAAARWRAEPSGPAGVLVIAIDGHGGSGKSTIAGAVAEAAGAALVHTDDFFQPLSVPPAGGPGQPPGTLPGQALERYYDWRRLRAQALEPLRARHRAAFRRFDWDRGAGLNGLVTVAPRDLILVEGVFSAAPQLSDLVTRSVFVDTPEPERLRRLRLRVTPEEWDTDWLIAERAYFDVTRPPSSFDLAVSGASRPAGKPGPQSGSIRAQQHGSSG